MPEVFITAWDALVVQGGLTSGRWALIHAGASGVGTAGIQIAKAVGAKVAVTCSTGKTDACRGLGADLVLERSPADWPAALDTGLAADGCTVGVDTILDVVGGDEADRNLRVVRPKGTIVQVGLMGGGAVTVNLGLLLAKRVRVDRHRRCGAARWRRRRRSAGASPTRCCRCSRRERCGR